MTRAIVLPRQIERDARDGWPYRPRPHDGELLSSFIARLSVGLGMRPITFLNSIMGSRKNFLAQDLDNFVPDNLARKLAAGCGISTDAIAACTLGSLRGALNHNHNKRGRNPWILPTTVDNNLRRRPGLQYCPLCLGEQKLHFRIVWRLGFVTTCTVHAVELRDRCPHCDEPVHILDANALWQCAKCDQNIRQTTGQAAATQLAWQLRAEVALRQGWVQLGDEFVSSTVWFAIARQIGALLVNGRYAQAFRSATVGLYGGDDRPFPKPTRRQPFEYLEVAERCRLFGMVAELMQQWPHRFVQAAWDAGIRRSHAIKDMVHVPFAYESVLRAYLDETPYYPTDSEVAAAAAWLRRTKGAAYYRDLKALCGESRKSIYRHMDYQRVQSRPSVWVQKIE